VHGVRLGHPMRPEPQTLVSSSSNPAYISPETPSPPSFRLSREYPLEATQFVTGFRGICEHPRRNSSSKVSPGPPPLFDHPLHSLAHLLMSSVRPNLQ
jgi:hypothetical protein